MERLRGLGSAGIGQLWLKWVVRRARDESPLLSPPGFRVGLEWVCLIRIQLISQATVVWVCLHAAAYSAGVW